MYKKRATPNGAVRTAVPGEIRLLMRKLATLTGSAASEGWWSASEMLNFVALVEPILFEINPYTEVHDAQTPIFPTPESESSEG